MRNNNRNIHKIYSYLYLYIFIRSTDLSASVVDLRNKLVMQEYVIARSDRTCNLAGPSPARLPSSRIYIIMGTVRLQYKGAS